MCTTVSCSKPCANCYTDTSSNGWFNCSLTPHCAMAPESDSITVQKALSLITVGNGTQHPFCYQNSLPVDQSGQGPHYFNHRKPRTRSNNKGNTCTEINPLQGPTYCTPVAHPSLVTTVPFAKCTEACWCLLTVQPNFMHNSWLIKLNNAPLSTNPKTWPAKLEDTGSVATIMCSKVHS